MEERYEIVKWEIIVRNNGEDGAELVGYDKYNNKYRINNKVYVHGEYHEVEPTYSFTSAQSSGAAVPNK